MNLENLAVKVMKDEPIISFIILEQQYSDEIDDVIIHNISEVFKDSGIGIEEVSNSEFTSATRVETKHMMVSRPYIDEYGKRKMMKNRESYIHMRDHWWWADPRYFWVDIHEFNNITIFRVGLNFKLEFQWSLVYFNDLIRKLSDKYGTAYYVFFTETGPEGYIGYRHGSLISKNCIGKKGSGKLSDFMKKYGYDINDILRKADIDIDYMMAPYDYKEYATLLSNIKNKKKTPVRIKQDVLLAPNIDEEFKKDLILDQIVDEMEAMEVYVNDLKSAIREKMKVKVEASIRYFKMNKTKEK